jgi:hypothetical protein
MVNASELHEILTYEPETGRLTWKVRKDVLLRWNVRYAGREAFTAIANGYRKGSIHNVSYQAHRVLWAMHHGEWPLGQVDHVNGDRGDNRISNLRQADGFQNSQNAKVRCDNTSGYPGVSFFKDRNQWTARICVNGKKIHLGYFSTAEMATKARKEAEKVHGFLKRS